MLIVVGNVSAEILRCKQIRQVALSLFVNQGYQAVSLRKLAGEVGIQTGSLYNHIESKQCLLYELIERHEAGLLRALKTGFSSVDPVASLKNFVADYLGFVFGDLQGLILCQREWGLLSDQQQHYILALRRSQQSVLSKIISDGKDQKIFAVVSLDSVVQAIISMLSGVSVWYSPNVTCDHSVVISHYQTMVCNLVRETPNNLR
nr:TetR/AcrR family transcriptional regulator [Pseudomonas sp. R5(2019)]